MNFADEMVGPERQGERVQGGGKFIFILVIGSLLIGALLAHSIQVTQAREVLHAQDARSAGSFSADYALQPGDTLTIQLYGWLDSPPQVRIEIAASSPAYQFAQTSDLDPGRDLDSMADRSNYRGGCITIANEHPSAGVFSVVLTPSTQQEYALMVIRNLGDWRVLYIILFAMGLLFLALYLRAGVRRYRERGREEGRGWHGGRFSQVLLLGNQARLGRAQNGLVFCLLLFGSLYSFSVYLGTNAILLDPIRQAQLVNFMTTGAIAAGVGIGSIFAALGIAVLVKRRRRAANLGAES